MEQGGSQSLHQDADDVMDSDSSTIGKEAQETNRDEGLLEDPPPDAQDDFQDQPDGRVVAMPPTASPKRGSTAPDVVRMR